MTRAPRSRSVFLNCPFDSHYRPIFDALVFTLCCAALTPRCALESDDSSEFRLEKIFRIIGDCRYGIHDISRTEVDIVHLLPRFNMPLELGIFLGCKRFGGRTHSGKRCLILDREPYRYQKFLSDVSGQDIHAHQNDPAKAVHEVRAWLRTACGISSVPGGGEIWRRYLLFRQDLPDTCRAMALREEELTFQDFVKAAQWWVRVNSH